MNALRLKSWSPYVVGALIGVLSWFSFASVDKPLGITTAFEYTAALAVRGVDPSAATENPYYKTAPGSEAELEGKEPKIDWEWMLVLGVAIGAAISSRLSGDRGTGEPVPRLWRERFGDSRGRRYLWAFIGGGLLMLGARIAQGCTSGHGISGALQLAVSSWLFVAVFVATAIAAAMAIYRGTGR